MSFGRYVLLGLEFVVILGVTVLVYEVAGRRLRVAPPVLLLVRVSNRARVVSGVAGFRGAVSLAAALAVPEVMASGGAFPDRDVIVFVTSGVIVVTLVLQGLLLPWVGVHLRVQRVAQLVGGEDV